MLNDVQMSLGELMHDAMEKGICAMHLAGLGSLGRRGFAPGAHLTHRRCRGR